MASTPSASALTAVLRCRGNIWTRNPPSKRTAASAYSLGLSGGAPARHPPAGGARSQKVSAREAPLSGRIAAGRGKPSAKRADRGAPGEESRGGAVTGGQLPNAEVSLGPEDARMTACGGGPLARQLALKLTSPLSGPGGRAQIVRIMEHACPARTCRALLVVPEGGTGRGPAGVVRLSASSRWTGNAGQVTCVVVRGWDALRVSCSSLTELVAQLVLCKLAALFGSSCGRDRDVGLQAKRHTSTPTGLDNKTGPKVTGGDRPD